MCVCESFCFVVVTSLDQDVDIGVVAPRVPPHTVQARIPMLKLKQSVSDSRDAGAAIPLIRPTFPLECAKGGKKMNKARIMVISMSLML